MSLSDSIERRLTYRYRCLTPQARALELAVCSQDIVHWTNHWAWTYDPRLPLSTVPFDLFPRQCEYLTWLAQREQAQENGLVEKSRDMGITWLSGLHAIHGWLFHDGYAVGFGSRKLDLVDKKGDPDCIFEKLRFLLHNLPDWMEPPGFKRDDHDCFAKLLNPANGSSITGEGGDDIGRGGRKSIYFVDEAAFLERPQAVERSLSQTTRCRIDLSTPNGPGNPFYTKRFSGNVSVFTFHWRDDPRKKQAWYDAECKRIGDPVIIAQELDIDYSASVEGICIPAAWVRAAVGLKLPESARLIVGFDVAEEGGANSVLVPRCGPVVKDPISWRGLLTTESAWKAREEAGKMGAQAVNYDCVGVGTGIKGTWGTTLKALPFQANAINTGEAPRDNVYWPDGRTSKEKFINLRAELWWRLRARFERTFEHVTKGIAHKPEEMISLPNCPALIAELSLPKYHRMENGKIKIESKQDMRRRGVKSPDFADALVLTEEDDGGVWEPRPADPRESLVASIPRDAWSDYQPDREDAEKW